MTRGNDIRVRQAGCRVWVKATQHEGRDGRSSRAMPLKQQGILPQNGDTHPMPRRFCSLGSPRKFPAPFSDVAGRSSFNEMGRKKMWRTFGNIPCNVCQSLCLPHLYFRSAPRLLGSRVKKTAHRRREGGVRVAVCRLGTPRPRRDRFPLLYTHRRNESQLRRRIKASQQMR